MSLAGRRILVAEDLYLVAIVTREAIEQSGGHVVGPFACNADCLAALDAEEIDAAVLDIGLADGSVFPVARRLRADGIPFLFLTGYDCDVVPGEFLAERCLIKPCSVDTLCRAITSLLDVGSSRSGPSGSPSPTTPHA